MEDTKMKRAYKIIILSLIFGFIGGAIGTSFMFQFNEKTNSEYVKDFYYAEGAVGVSPHHIRKAMDKGDTSFILVDLRSDEEYEEEHVTGALNIPAYKDPDTSAYGDVERIVSSFEALPKDKEVIMYCYSIPCMTGRKIGKMLAEHGIYVKHLNVGWNEWRYAWNTWNHPHEWNVTDVMDYVISGTEPGTPKTNAESKACPIEGTFGC
tara:strand:- start:5119 stop:5742 length:624 start_codon:yes stop_codon:yes gene_type:complete